MAVRCAEASKGGYRRRVHSGHRLRERVRVVFDFARKCCNRVVWPVYAIQRNRRRFRLYTVKLVIGVAGAKSWACRTAENSASTACNDPANLGMVTWPPFSKADDKAWHQAGMPYVSRQIGRILTPFYDYAHQSLRVQS